MLKKTVYFVFLFSISLFINNSALAIKEADYEQRVQDEIDEVSPEIKFNSSHQEVDAHDLFQIIEIFFNILNNLRLTH